MPLSTNVLCAPLAKVRSIGEPTCRWWLFAYPLSVNAPFEPSVASVAFEPCTQSSLNIVAAGGLTAVAKNDEPKASASPVRTLPTACDDRALGSGVRDRRRDRREVVLRRDRVVGVVPDVVDRAAEALRDPGREHRDERDERESDHQRRRGRGRALRVAAGVVTRERPGGAADARRGPAQRPGERADEAHREQRDADEDHQRAEAHVEQDGLRPEVRHEEAEEQQGEPERGEDRRAHRAVAGEARRRQRRALAHRGDRLHAGRAERRPHARDQRDDDPDERAR